MSRRARARRDHRRRAEVDAAGEAAPGERGEARALGKDLEAAIGAGLADAKRAQVGGSARFQSPPVDTIMGVLSLIPLRALPLSERAEPEPCWAALAVCFEAWV